MYLVIDKKIGKYDVFVNAKDLYGIYEIYETPDSYIIKYNNNTCINEFINMF